MTARTQHGAVSWRRAAAAAPLIALVLTGCGSTALRGNAALGGAGLDSAGTTTGGVIGTTSGTSGGTTGATGASLGTTGVASNGSATGGSTSGTGSGTSTGGGGSTTTTTGGGKSSSKKPIRIGFPGADVTAIFAAFGHAGDAPSDMWAGEKALIKYINDHGGIGGRPISPVFHNVNATGDASTEGQKACQDFTQDNKVDVVVDGLGSAVLATCLKQAGIADFGTTNWLPDTADLAKAPNWMTPTGMQIDRQIEGLLQISVAQGRLKRGDKLGVMVEDCPYGHRTYDNIVVPFAKRLGITVTQSSVKCLTSLEEDIATITNDVQRAELTFSSTGVTHVIALHVAEAFLISNFTQNAAQQRYFPKYLVTSNTYPWQNSQSGATIKIDPSALPNMSGAGYMPLLDVGSNFKAAGAQKAAEDVCTKIDPTQAGASSLSAYEKPFRQNLFFSGCGGLFIVKATIEAAGMNLNYRALRVAYATLKRDRFVSTMLGGGSIGGPADVTDGVGYMQPFAYNTTRKTFLFTGAAVAVS